MLKAVLNYPVDVDRIRSLVVEPSDLRLMMPTAIVPFDPIQWREKLNPADNILSFFTYDESGVHGHFAIMKIDPTSRAAWLGLVYLHPRVRGTDMARDLLTSAEGFARESLALRNLNLNVVPSNVRAYRLYLRAGYEVFEQTSDMIRMRKSL